MVSSDPFPHGLNQPKCPVSAPAREPAAFNAHKLRAGAGGLVQHVFRLPARTQIAEPPRRDLCAAPPSEKRFLLSRLKARRVGASQNPSRASSIRTSVSGDRFGMTRRRRERRCQDGWPHAAPVVSAHLELDDFARLGCRTFFDDKIATLCFRFSPHDLADWPGGVDDR